MVFLYIHVCQFYLLNFSFNNFLIDPSTPYSEISINKILHNCFAFLYYRTAPSKVRSHSENIEQLFVYQRLISERKYGLAKSKLYLSHLKKKITEMRVFYRFILNSKYNIFLSVIDRQ